MNALINQSSKEMDDTLKLREYVDIITQHLYNWDLRKFSENEVSPRNISGPKLYLGNYKESVVEYIWKCHTVDLHLKAYLASDKDTTYSLKAFGSKIGCPRSEITNMKELHVSDMARMIRFYRENNPPQHEAITVPSDVT